MKMKNIALKGLAIGIMISSAFSCAVKAEDEKAYAVTVNEYVDDYVIYDGETLTGEETELIYAEGKVTDDEPVWEYTYTIPRDGKYCLEIYDLRENTSVNAYLIDDWGNANGFSSYSYDLKEGETYIIRVKQGHGNTDFKLKIGVQKETVIIPEDITRIDDQINYYDQRNYYEFTAPVKGLYYFELDDCTANADFNCFMWNEDGVRIIDESLWHSLHKSIELDPGKYKIAVEQDTGYGKYSFYIGYPQKTIDITGYTSVTDKLEFSAQENYYEFTAPVSGTYSFSYTTKADKIVQFYMWEGKERFQGFNTFPHDQYKHTLTFTLEAGKKYTLCATTYQSLDTYTINLGYPAEAEAFLQNIKQNGGVAGGEDISIDDNTTIPTHTNEEYDKLQSDYDELLKNYEELNAKYKLLTGILSDAGINLNDIIEIVTDDAKE